MTAPKKTDALTRARAKIRRIADGWENIVTGLGTSRDKRTGARMTVIPPTVNRKILEDLYSGDDMAAVIADKPAEDMVRKWISLTVETGEAGLADTERELADDTLQALNELDATGAFREALTWARVYGGGLIFVGVDDGGGESADLSEPVNESRIRAIRFLEVFDRFDVEIDTEYTDPATDGIEKFGKPKTYRLTNYQGNRGASLQSVVIHESRFLRFDGPLTSRRRRIRNNGWNDSVYTRIETVLADFGLSWGSAAHLIQDFGAAVFKMTGLADAVAGEEGNLVLQRLSTMDQCRSTVRMTPIDAELEDFERQATPITGLAELMDRFMLRLAAAARMPVTVLFGISPAGLNTTAEGDLSIWYDHVGSMQETEVRKPLSRILRLLFLAAEGPTKGKEPEGWEFSFNPLWQMDEKERAVARKTQAETDQIYIDTNVLEPEEVAESRFGGESYSYDTALDKEAREAEPKGGEPEPEAVIAAPIPAPMAPPPAPTQPLAELEGEI